MGAFRHHTASGNLAADGQVVIPATHPDDPSLRLVSASWYAGTDFGGGTLAAQVTPGQGSPVEPPEGAKELTATGAQSISDGSLLAYNGLLLDLSGSSSPDLDWSYWAIYR
jgi:hypothetical protein